MVVDGAAVREVIPAHGRDGVALVLVTVALGWRIELGAVSRAVVELAHVALAGPVAGPERLARRQRKPAHGPLGMAAADKTHQRGRVHRTLGQSPRHPGPAWADLRPAPVVKRRKAPGRLIDPGPAPGRNPTPLTGAVGRPIFRYGAGNPDVAVSGVALPVAIVVELLVADCFARHVARRNRVFFGAVAPGAPLVKMVLHRCTGRRRYQAGAGEGALLRAFQRQRCVVVAIDQRAARQRHHPRGVASRVDIEPVGAGLSHHKR